VIVEDDGRHLRCGEVGVIEFLHERPMLLGGQSIAEELLSGTGWQKHDGVAKSMTVTRPPSTRPQRWRTFAGTDIWPLFETRNSLAVAISRLRAVSITW
jgi:hypothetical protein